MNLWIFPKIYTFLAGYNFAKVAAVTNNAPAKVGNDLTLDYLYETAGQPKEDLIKK